MQLSDDQVNAIVVHARRDAPQEACGIIIGIGTQAKQVIPLANTADDPLHRYEVDPAGFVRAVLAAEQQLIGIYHSHPGGDPIPSPTDVHEAAYPDAAYLIVGHKDHIPRLAAWHIDGSVVERLPLVTGPLPAASKSADSLSLAQKAAIITGAVLAVILLLIISFSLLPSAPPG